MGGRILFSNAHYEARWYEPALGPITLVTNAAVAAWAYPSWRTARVKWEPDVDDFYRFLRESKNSVICYGWHAYELLTFCAFRDFPSDLMPTGIGHDGFRSRIVHQSSAWYGFPVWVYRRRSPVPARQQLAEFLTESRRIIGLLADAGGPDYVLKPGIVDVARTTTSFLVPMVLSARPVITIPWPRRYCLPLPFSRVFASYGEPIDGSRATVKECQSALEKLEARVATAQEKR